MKILFLLCIAGAAGTLLRYGVMKLAGLLPLDFPLGTLTVNITGAFLAGLCFTLCRLKIQQHEEYFPILFIGFLGAFTTFSTFTLDSVKLFSDAQYGKFALNILLQNTAGLAAAGIGFWLPGFFCR